MAARTLTSNANFDDATMTSQAPLADNDTLNINGAVLTCDGDTRWGQRAIASGTSSVFGLITGSSTLGGDLMVDARNTWWLPYTTRSGNVPSLGTVGVQNCTGATSGATGEFLGIWTALGTSPLSAGTAIPANGFIKFRSKVGTFGSETINLPGGATITSTGPGQRGWLNWVSVGNITHIFNRPNNLSWKGDQFALGTTTGSDGQVLQSPVADYLPLMEVETSAGSGVYEKWTGCFEGIPQPLRNSFSVTGCANNGSGLVRITSAAHGLSTSDVVTVAGVAGATGANGSFTVTVISTTVFDLQGSTFGGTWTSATGAFRFTGTTGLTNAIAVTGAASNAATIPLIRITTSRAHGLATGQPVKISGVGGTTEANGSYIVTVITTTTFDLQNSIWDSTHTYTSGGQMQLSNWNERLVNCPHYNITGIADNGHGYMRVAITAPSPYKVINRQDTLNGVAQTVSGVMNITNSTGLITGIPGAKAWINGITGTGAVSSLNSTEQIFGWNGTLAILAGTAWGGSYTSGGLASQINNPYATGTQFSIASITSGTSSRMRLTLTLPHALATGDTVTLNGILGSTNILALAGKPYTITVVSSLIVELNSTTFTGGDTFICGMLIDVASLQTVKITGITGTADAAGLNGNTYQAVPVDATHFDLMVAYGSGGYISGGVSTHNGDRRGRCYLMGADGKITFGGPTTGCGLLPPSGCAVRCPNLFVSTATAQAYAWNESIQLASVGSSGLRTKFTINQATVDFSYVSCPTALINISGAYSFSANYVYTCDQFATSSGIQPFTIANCGAVTTYDFTGSLNISNSPSGGTISSSTFCRNMGIVFAITQGVITASNNWTMSSTEFTGGMNGTVPGPQLSYCQNFTISGLSANGLSLTSCTAGKITNLKLAEKAAGIPNGSTSSITLFIIACNDIAIDGLSFAFGTSSPAAATFLSLTNGSSNIRLRNIGTYAAPYDFKNVMGSQIVLASGFPTRIRCNNVWIKNPKLASLGSWNVTATSDMVLSDMGDPNGKSQIITNSFQGWTGQRRRIWLGDVQTFGSGIGQLSQGATQPGSHFYDYIVDGGTSNLLTLIFNEKSSVYPSNIAYTIDAGTPKFNGNGSLIMLALNDQITYTWTYRVKGATAFANIAPVIAGTNTSNHTITYDLDKGQGFSGTFKTLNATNLAAETGISSVGVIPRIRIVCHSANSTNALTGIGFYATTDLTTIAATPYENHLLNLNFTGLVTGSSIDIYKVSDGTSQVLDFVSTGSTLTVPTPWISDYAAIARISLCGYAPIDMPITVTEVDQSLPVSQTRWTTVPLTNPGSLNITVTDLGASPITIGGKAFGIKIIDTGDAYTATQIANYYHWNRTLEAQWNGHQGHDWPTGIIPNATSFETVNGVLYGSAGTEPKGVIVLKADGATLHTGFTRFMADDGTYVVPATTYSYVVSNMVSGSRLLIRRTDTSAVLYNGIPGTSYSYDYTYSSDIPTEIIVRNSTSAPYYQEWRTTATLGSASGGATANQQLDQ